MRVLVKVASLSESQETHILKTVQIEQSLSPGEREQLQGVVLEFADIFALDRSVH